MSTEVITLEVDSEAARAFKSASAEEREKLQVWLGILLKECAKSSRSLKEAMDEMGRGARERGLTPEILDSIR
jgi:hypothetical protein